MRIASDDTVLNDPQIFGILQVKYPFRSVLRNGRELHAVPKIHFRHRHRHLHSYQPSR